MPLRISNPTMQDWTFSYRIGDLGSPEFRILRQVPLPRGGQVELILGVPQTAQVIRQLEDHGARPADEIHSKLRNFSGLIYSDIRVISTEEIEDANVAEMQTREERSRDQAVRAGLGYDKAARRATNDRPGARVTEIEVIQETPRGQRRKGGEMAFSMSVTPEGGDDPIVRQAVTA